MTFVFDPSVYTIPLCFAEGTQIETVAGPMAVEDLAVGDEVVTASGERRAVTWIGEMVSRPKTHPRPWEVNPICVRAHAFGPGQPTRDMRLSPGHAVHVDGVLVPVGHLVNGATILQEAVDAIHYYHVELETHDLLIAENLPCESYFDDGNRTSFSNVDGITEIHGRLDPKSWDHACAPMVAAGPQLTELQDRLRRQAETVGWTLIEEPAVRMVADDAEIAPVQAHGNRFTFSVPAAARVVLRSNNGVLAQVMPGLADTRQLGVAVSELRVNGVPVALDGPDFGAGFYPVERQEDAAWRWTNGEAELPRLGTGPTLVEIAIIMAAPSWKQSLPTLRIVHAA